MTEDSARLVNNTENINSFCDASNNNTQEIEHELNNFSDYLVYERQRNGKGSSKPLSERTKILYLTYIKELLEIEGLGLTRNQIKHYHENHLLKAPRKVNNKPYSHNSLTNITVALNHYAQFKKLNIKLPLYYPKEVAIKPLTKAELEDIINAPLKANDLLYHSLFLAFKEMGQRQVDVRGINIDGLDLENLRIRMNIKKLGNEQHTAIISERLAIAIKKYIELQRVAPSDGSNALWTAPTGRRIAHSSLSNYLKKYAVKAGIKKKVHPHLFRHSAITLAVEHGVGPKTTMELYKIRNIKTLCRYSHPSEEHLRSEFDRILNGSNEAPKIESVPINKENGGDRKARLREKLEESYILGTISEEQYKQSLRRLETLETKT